jgi:hypothetical protein
MQYRSVISSSLLWVCAFGLAGPSLAHAQAAGEPLPAAPVPAKQTAPVAASQFAEPPPVGPAIPAPVRESRFRSSGSWFLGGDFGVGAVTRGWSDGSDAGSSAQFLHLRFGGMLSERLGLSVELWSDGYKDEEFFETEQATQNVIALAVSYYLSPRLWVATGLGSATLRDYSGSETVTAEGSGLMVGLGYELFARPKYSIDLTMRTIMSSYEFGWAELSRTSVAFGAGATWH